jgi:hypothetical protein
VGLMQPKVFQRALRTHELPGLGPFCCLKTKNIKYAAAYAKYSFAPRDPRYWDELGRGCAASERYEEALACYDYALAVC